MKRTSTQDKKEVGLGGSIAQDPGSLFPTTEDYDNFSGKQFRPGQNEVSGFHTKKME